MGESYVVIPSGSSSTTITITPIDDAAVEGDETVILTIANNAGYTRGTPYAATVTITDNDELAEVTIAATDASEMCIRDRIRTAHQNIIDVVGTGGDASGTFNISTAAAPVSYTHLDVYKRQGCWRSSRRMALKAGALALFSRIHSRAKLPS